MLEIRHEGMNNTPATQKTYNEIYNSVGIRHLDSLYLWLIGLLKAPKGSRLLDISCGEGRLVTLAQRAGIDAAGVDFALSAVREAISQDRISGWIVGDGESLPVRYDCYDFITHIGSLEHYQDPMAGIREIYRVLKPDGIACILLPNSFGLLGNIINVYRTGHIFDDGQPLQRYNTLKGWQSMLEECNLIPFKILKYEIPRPCTWADVGWFLKHPVKLIHLFFSVLIPVNFGNSIVYLCKRNRFA